MLLNNQVLEDKLTSHAPLKKIINNLANEENCNQCKANNIDSTDNKCPKEEVKGKGGFVNLAFVDSTAERSAWYQPHLPRDLALTLLTPLTPGCFVVRNSQSQAGNNCLALIVRVP